MSGGLLRTFRVKRLAWACQSLIMVVVLPWQRPGTVHRKWVLLPLKLTWPTLMHIMGNEKTRAAKLHAAEEVLKVNVQKIHHSPDPAPKP